MEINQLEDDLIYSGAKISNAISMLLIMTFSTTYKLGGAALKDLLSLINIHCLVPHNLLQSLYKFKQFFSYLKTSLKITTTVQGTVYLLATVAPTQPAN